MSRYKVIEGVYGDVDVGERWSKESIVLSGFEGALTIDVVRRR